MIRSLSRGPLGRAAVVLVLGVASLAHADDGEYVRRDGQAKALAGRKNYRGAIKEFLAAYAIDPRPEALFNVGLAHQKLALQPGGAAEDARRSEDFFDQYMDRYRAVHGGESPLRATIDRYRRELTAKWGPPPVASNPAVKNPERSVGPPASENPVSPVTGTSQKETTDPVKTPALGISVPTTPVVAPTGAPVIILPVDPVDQKPAPKSKSKVGLYATAGVVAGVLAAGGVTAGLLLGLPNNAPDPMTGLGTQPVRF